MRARSCFLWLSSLLLAAAGATAHSVFVEDDDFTEAAPYDVIDAEHAQAIYAQIRTVGDVDVYRIRLTAPARIYARVNTPYCKQYADFGVNVALVGPALPAPTVALPSALPAGSGAVVVRDPIVLGGTRELWREPFSSRQMWLGDELAVDDAPPGEYLLVFWNEQGRVGDYIAVIGEREGGASSAGHSMDGARRPAGKRSAKSLMVECDPTQTP